MSETVISMLGQFRDEVLAGKRTTAWRPGHRDYVEGPATIEFLAMSGTSKLPHRDRDRYPSVDVIITKVEHTIASGKYANYMKLVQPEQEGRITLLEWVPVE